MVALGWLITALARAGLTLAAMLEKAAEPSITGAVWAQETKDIVRRKFSQTWPQVATTGDTVDGELARHLEMVCLRRHLPTELAALHPVTDRLPYGLPPYIKLGGLHAAIGLIFKAFSLRPAFASGHGHHARADCFWCHEPGTECGAHFLTCRKAPADVAARVATMLDQIIAEALPPVAATAPQPQTRYNIYAQQQQQQQRQRAALTYAYRLEWPRMTKPTLINTLKTLGRIINMYRHAWPGEHGARNPIRRVTIAP